MSLPTQDDLIGFGFGMNGEPAAWLATSPDYVEQTLGWGMNGEPFNAPAFVAPIPVPIISGQPAIFVAT